MSLCVFTNMRYRHFSYNVRTFCLVDTTMVCWGSSPGSEVQDRVRASSVMVRVRLAV